MPEIIQIPSERHAQLKTLADGLGLSINDTIGHLIRQEIAKGNLHDTMPGFTIRAYASHVAFGIDDGRVTKLNGANAVALADLIETMVTGKMVSVLNADIMVTVTRVGTGIKIDLHDGGSRVVSRDVARDIAAILRRTVAAALRKQVAEAEGVVSRRRRPAVSQPDAKAL